MFDSIGVSGFVLTFVLIEVLIVCPDLICLFNLNYWCVLSTLLFVNSVFVKSVCRRYVGSCASKEL